MLHNICNPASDRSIIRVDHILVKTQNIQHIAYTEIAGSFIFIIVELNNISNDLIVLVIYLTDQFFDDILQSDYTFSSAVLICYNSHMHFRTLHIFHCFAYEHCISDMRNVLNYGSDIISALHQHFEE